MERLETPDRLRLLLDGELKPSQIRELETWLSSCDDETSRRRVLAIRQIVAGFSKHPHDTTSGGIWSRVRATMDGTGAGLAPDRTPRYRVAGLIACAILLAFGLGWMIRSQPPRPSQPGFGKILDLYSFNPDVAATAYNSKSGNATIIWVSGMDEDPTHFGQIWHVYSFKPGVTATSYDSEKAGATIIWVSGMDDLPPPSRPTSF